jgi:hypothetical protein
MALSFFSKSEFAMGTFFFQAPIVTYAVLRQGVEQVQLRGGK